MAGYWMLPDCLGRTGVTSSGGNTESVTSISSLLADSFSSSFFSSSSSSESAILSAGEDCSECEINDS